MYALENNLRNEQAGFCPNRSCIDQINTLRIITEQSVELQSPLYMVLVDYKRAVDSLNRECIWKELKEARGLPSKFLNLINEGYNSFSCRIYHNGHLSEPFLTTSGIRQGCLLSPLLFLLVLDSTLKRVMNDKMNCVEMDELTGRP
jgi:hypothetical protein